MASPTQKHTNLSYYIVGAGLGSARVFRTAGPCVLPSCPHRTPRLHRTPATPKIYPRTVGGPAMQAPTSKKQGLRKKISLFQNFIVGASIARPPSPHPQPLNTPPHRWRACNAGPYKQKASPTQKHPQPFLLYSRGEHCSPAFAERWLLRFAPYPHRTPPPSPHPQPRKYTPAPLAGLPCRPLQAKGKPRANTPQTFPII